MSFFTEEWICLKDDRCDFSHHPCSNNMFAPQCPQNLTGHAPTSYPPQLNFDQSPFPADPRHFPPFQFPINVLPLFTIIPIPTSTPIPTTNKTSNKFLKSKIKIAHLNIRSLKNRDHLTQFRLLA